MAPTLTMPVVSAVDQPAPVEQGSPAAEPEPEPALVPAAKARAHQSGRPSTVPAVHLSWREADSLDLGVPMVDDSDNAIVLEPPSQLVADTRRRSGPRGAPRTTTGWRTRTPRPDGTPVDPTELAADAEENPATRAAARAAARDAEARKVRRRRVLVLAAVVLLVLVVVGWLVLRGGGSDTAAPRGSGSSTVAATASAEGPPTRA